MSNKLRTARTSAGLFTALILAAGCDMAAQQEKHSGSNMPASAPVAATSGPRGSGPNALPGQTSGAFGLQPGMATSSVPGVDPALPRNTATGTSTPGRSGP